jgi:hypothetical protein
MYWLGLLSLIFFIKYNQGNIYQIGYDLYNLGVNDSLTYSTSRIQPLLIKHRLNKYPKLGRYEKYVLNREVRKYVSYGGRMMYFKWIRE